MQSGLLLLNVLLMLTMPLALGWLINKRLGVGWRLFFIGGATFVIVQLAHIPFNYVVLSTAASWLDNLSASTRILITAVFAGLSAAVFEEGGRYVSYRYWARDARTWSKGVMMGAGHGGVEAIILGLLAGINIVFFIGYRAGFFQNIVDAGAQVLISETVDALFTLPWYQMLFGALERFSAICIQIALSVIVLQVFTRSNILWLFLAIAWHALVDAVAVWSIASWGSVITELIILTFALFSIVFIFRLRTPEPEEPEPDPLPEIGGVKQLELEATTEKIKDSRFLS